MSASKMDAVVLQCDQGMGTLVRIYENAPTEKLVNLVLIDLGSEIGTVRFAGDAIDVVIRSLKQMSAPRIDLLVISHQDYDHWSLLPDLLTRIKSEVPATTLGAIYRGGLSWDAKPLAAVEEYETHFGVKAVIATKSYSDYEWDPPHELASCAGVVFRVLAVNTPTRSARDLTRNGTSAVIVVEFAKQKIIVPGDATADTLGFINKILATWEQFGLDNPIVPCFMLGAPHHGALRTIADNFTTKNSRLDIAKKFAEEVEADRVAASAGFESKFRHPFKRVIDLLGAWVYGGASDHTYIVYDDSSRKWDAVTTTERIYTTIQGLVEPERTSWRFTVTAAGELSIDPIRHGPVRAQARNAETHTARPR